MHLITILFLLASIVMPPPLTFVIGCVLLLVIAGRIVNRMIHWYKLSGRKQ